MVLTQCHFMCHFLFFFHLACVIVADVLVHHESIYFMRMGLYKTHMKLDLQPFKLVTLYFEHERVKRRIEVE